MRILFVLEHFYPYIGGAETLSISLTTWLAQQGHRCVVITSRLKDTSKFEKLGNIAIHRVSLPSFGRRYWFTILGIPKAWRLAKECDIVQTSTYNAALPAWLAARLRGKKCIITVYEIFGQLWSKLPGMSTLKAIPYKAFEKAVVSLDFDKFVCISNFTKQCLREVGIPEIKLKVIYPFIDYNLFDSSKTDGRRIRRELGIEDQFIYMFFGRPGISKGSEYLVQAAVDIRKKIPRSKLVLMLAKSPWRRYNRIKRMITYLGLEKDILLLNPVARRDLPNYISAADCVVVPSFSEGFGFTAVEASALNIPVVVAAAGALPEVVSGKYVLISPGNVESIVRGVLDVYKNNLLISPLKVFDQDSSGKGYVEVYEEVLSND